MTGSALIRTIVLTISSLMLLCGDSAFAQGRLCNATSWRSATGPSVRASIQAGYSPTAPCPKSREGDYPIHLAAVLANDARAVQVLVDAGASPLTTNAAGETAISLFEARYEQAVLSFGRPSPALTAIAGILTVEFEAAAAAQSSLCSLDWWLNPVNPNAEAAVMSPGVSLDTSCDSEGNTPLLIALSLEHILEPQYSAITWLIYAGARNIPNRRGATPLNVAENRYERILIEWDNVIVPQICSGRTGIGEQFLNGVTPEWNTYIYVKGNYTRESQEQVKSRTLSRFRASDCAARMP